MTELVGTIEHLAELIDSDRLNAAVKEGICDSPEYSYREPADDDGRFYEGEATQPFHVASGLVVHRPDVISMISSGLKERSAVMITGPSGVGKSAVLWTLPQAFPGVLWYRVRRLADDDVPLIVRLARAYLAMPLNRVGFLVDSAGTGDFAGWARLRAEAAAVPGMLVVATARGEDLITLGDVAECATVQVRLDEHAAETIHEGLVRRGTTDAAHWREAFDRSDGLTLEFTHMLTRGRRLRDVIRDQITRRIREGRYDELEVLALASVADRWSATLSTEGVARACEMSDATLRGALGRLNAEHLVVERDGQIEGLHRLRSAAICEAVHEPPPPVLDETITKVIPLVPASQLHRFVAAVLSDYSDARNVVIEAACEDSLGVDRVAAYLQGLRLADFRERALVWNEIAEQHAIPIAVRPLVFMFAVGGVEPDGLFPDEVNEAWAQMVDTAEWTSRDDLVAAIGSSELARLLASTSDIGKATQLLAVLAGVGPEFAAVTADAIAEQPTLALTLREAPVEALADCVAAAYDADASLARSLVESAGGEATVIKRIRADNPWITQLEVSESAGGPVGVARLLHLSDTLQGDPDEQAHNLARTLLRCLPRIESTDVKALDPGGAELAIGGHVRGVSRLTRANDHATPGAAWIQARTRIAIALVADADTARLAAARPLLDEAAELARRIATATVTEKLVTPGLDQRLQALHDKGRNLRPPYGRSRIGDTAILEQEPPQLANHPFDLIVAITGNVIRRFHTRPAEHRALAAYIAETVIDKNLNGAINEPWQLVDIDGHPPSLDDLRATLDDIRAVADEQADDNADTVTITKRALDGSSTRALRRAADACRAAKNDRQQERREGIQDVCRTTGLRASLFDSAQTSATLIEHRVSVDLDSLLDWFAAVETLEAALGADQRPGEMYVFVPLRHNRPVPGLAARLIGRLWPEPDPVGLEKLREPHSSALADLFDQATDALQVLSGICGLPSEERAHIKIQDVAEAVAARLAAACEQIRALPDDPVTELMLTIIGGLSARVQAENAGTSTEPNLAAQTTPLGDDGITADSRTIAATRCFALEWDIDPRAAVELLLSTTG